MPSCDHLGRVVTMETQEVLEALNHELFVVSGGTVRIKEPSTSLDKWFPAIEIIEPNGKPMKMSGWGITLKYRPHGSGEAIDKNERTVVELEYRQKDPAIMKKMADSKHPNIVVNELSPKVTYMFAHMRLYPLLDLSKPIESQGAAIDQIHENTLELINWWMGIR